jgi:hypothetical protein
LRHKADELRILADGMTSHHARMTLLCLAEDYDKLSRHAGRTVPAAREGDPRERDRRAMG